MLLSARFRVSPESLFNESLMDSLGSHQYYFSCQVALSFIISTSIDTGSLVHLAFMSITAVAISRSIHISIIFEMCLLGVHDYYSC